MKIYKDVHMKNYSNMNIGGIADELIFIEDKSELPEIYKNNKDFFILGNGTNTLISDGKINKSFISLKSLDKIERLTDLELRVEAGLDFDKLIKYMRKENLSGLENLAGIPGSVGGLVFMNGGAYGTEIFDFISEVEVMDEEHVIRTIKKENLHYTYRSTEIKSRKWVVISVVFKFKKGFDKVKVDELKDKRESRHPLELPNLGSTFKNPENNYSAKLIIEAGIQGHKIGDAQISKKHPNFIVNKGNARFEDVISLIDYVKEKVKENSGVDLNEEIIIIK